jgi:hypothetical protein
MRRRIAVTLAALAATVILALAVASASANHLSISSSSIYIAFHPMTIVSVGETVECNTTILGRFHEGTISKVAHALIGAITHMDIENPCTGGTATVLEESLPWHISYEAFISTSGLPSIDRIRILVLGLTIDVFVNSFGVNCLAQTSEEEPAAGWAELESGGSIDNFRLDELLEIALTGGFLCSLASSATLDGNGSVEDGEGGLIFVRLI